MKMLLKKDNKDLIKVDYDGEKWKIYKNNIYIGYFVIKGEDNSADFIFNEDYNEEDKSFLANFIIKKMGNE